MTNEQTTEYLARALAVLALSALLWAIGAACYGVVRIVRAVFA